MCVCVCVCVCVMTAPSSLMIGHLLILIKEKKHLSIRRLKWQMPV